MASSVMRFGARFGIVTAAMLALAACGRDAPPPMVAAAPPPPQAEAAPPPAAVSADQQFLDQAATGGVAEVEAGKLAQQQAQSKAVKGFGAHMVRDHGAANAKLAALAKKLNMAANAGPADTSQLSGASGADFDKTYMASQVLAHQDAIAAFEAEANNGQNAQLKRFAKGSLQMLRGHLKQAEALAKKLGS